MNPPVGVPIEPVSLAGLLVRIGILALGTIITLRVASVLIRRIEVAIRAEAKGTEHAREKRARTIGEVLRSVSRGLILTVAMLMGARVSGLDITPALAAAGGFGVAAGLGAQSLVRDWISGFLIIHENQYDVGDVIRVAGVSGTVETLSLRHTELRDGEGFIHFIPNGEIKVVTNLTKSWSTPLVRIPVSLTEDPDRAMALVEETLAEFRERPDLKPLLIEPPRLLGIEDVLPGQFTILIQAKTVPEQRLAVSRALRLAVLGRLRAGGVQVHANAGGPS